MKKRLIALCLVFMLGFADVQAGTIAGPGTLSCGTLLAEKDEIIRNTIMAWVVGYLSGLDMHPGRDFLKGYEINGITGAINKYCQENPLKQIYGAANDVYLQMIKARK